MQVRSPAIILVAMALLGLLAAPLAGTDAARAAETPRPRVVVVVGPTHELTRSNLADGEKLARIAESNGADVTRVFHPNATWSAVVAAAQGANVLIYVGHGSGWPSPHVSALNPDRHDGMGLNPEAGGSASSVRYYGERLIAGAISLAPNALVILSHGCYTAGSSEPGYADPTQAVALRRVDNYAAGFLAAGAGAVIALGLYDADPVLKGLWGTRRTLDQLFMASGAVGRYEVVADSTRTPGARIHLDPHAASKFYRAITGNLDLLTTSVLQPSAEPPGGGTGAGPGTGDTTPPLAGIVDLPDTVDGETFTVGWNAVDTGSGVATCDVEVSTDGGPWAPWLTGATDRTASFPGQAGRGYAFRVRCVDRAGNAGPWNVDTVWTATPALAAGGFARVAVTTLNVRAAAGTSASRIGSVGDATIVSLAEGPVSANGYDWYRIAYPLREWRPVGALQPSGWVAAGTSAEPFLVPARAPNATTVPTGGSQQSVATWYCLPDASACTNGYPASGMYAALSLDYGIPIGSLVRVCHGAQCVTVTNVDICRSGPRVVDLYAAAFAVLAPLGTGRIAITVEAVPGDGSTPPPVTPDPVPPTVTMAIAPGYRTKLAGGFSSSTSVANGAYVTFHVSISPAAANVPVSFFQRIGKSGAWTFLSGGRTDAAGLVTWSKAVRVAPAAKGYDRYVYFRASTRGAAGVAGVWSGGVRAVAR